MNDKPSLTTPLLIQEARVFGTLESQHQEPLLYGITDGKAVGTYLEQKFRLYLQERYEFMAGSSAEGIDLPGLLVDFKTTSVRQPQSSCPFKSARQKVYGLGYSLLIFVYEKRDDPIASTANLLVRHVIFVEKERTADFQTTMGLRRILDNEGNEDDIIAFLSERMLPVDEIQAVALAQEILQNPPEVGYLTISNALQWRLQYARAIEQAGSIAGIIKVL
ncbi:MAG TPA: hypothetical protein VFB21_02895 [Chthonomonadaceae bacterium]|nr:hypothetical protein [Chthonomonadaceae bacterium]